MTPPLPLLQDKPRPTAPRPIEPDHADDQPRLSLRMAILVIGAGSAGLWLLIVTLVHFI